MIWWMQSATQLFIINLDFYYSRSNQLKLKFNTQTVSIIDLKSIRCRARYIAIVSFSINCNLFTFFCLFLIYVLLVHGKSV